MAIDYALYHPKWALITYLIRFKRAESKCERCSSLHGRPHRSTGYRVSLATVHLNHDRTYNRFENLAALCQSCHMWWDHKRHMYNRKYGKETYYQNGVLFSVNEVKIFVTLFSGPSSEKIHTSFSNYTHCLLIDFCLREKKRQFGSLSNT